LHEAARSGGAGGFDRPRHYAEPVRGRAVIGAICAALGSWVVSAWFSVNGPNYDGWSRTFTAFVGVIVLALVALLIGRSPITRRSLIVATAAGAVVAVLVGVTIHWYGDGMPASNVPSTLAWVGLAALIVGAGALSIPTVQRPRLG